MSQELKLGIPKGSLENATINLFKQAGWKITAKSRNYFPTCDDDEVSCRLVRPQEMSQVLERGVLDVGIAGRDWVRENDSDVVEVGEMVYSKVSRRPARWVLVVGPDSKVTKPEDLDGRTGADCQQGRLERPLETDQDRADLCVVAVGPACRGHGWSKDRMHPAIKSLRLSRFYPALTGPLWHISTGLTGSPSKQFCVRMKFAISFTS